MAMEKSGPRMFANMYAKNAVAVIVREVASSQLGPLSRKEKENATIVFAEADHRLFVIARDPGKVIVLNRIPARS
jgi:hypothetical protein